MINCPVCEGTKVSPIGGGNICKCCDGIGQITKEHYDALKSIRYSIAKKMHSICPERYTDPDERKNDE